MRLSYLLSLILLCCSALGQDSVRTIAGNALQTGAQDGSLDQARFNDPAALASDFTGNLFIADSRNRSIRRVSTNGAVTTITASGANFDTPSGIAVSLQGVIISDAGAHIIRRVNPDGSTVTLAGSMGQPGFEDGVGSAARFDSPLGLAVSTNGVIYVADCGNHTIRAISTEGVVTTIAGSPGAWGTADGNGANARFNGPIGLAQDSQGNLFVSDSNNHSIRKIAPDHGVTTYAGIPLANGFANGDRLKSKFFNPAEIAVDPNDFLYVADSMNHAIRKISPDGKVSTVTGFSNRPGAEDGANGRARLYNPYGVTILPTGELAFTDTYNQTVRAAIPPAQLNISIGRAVSLHWNSVIGATYQIQAADSSFASWSNITDPIVATNFFSYDGVSPEEGPHFFRLIFKP